MVGSASANLQHVLPSRYGPERCGRSGGAPEGAPQRGSHIDAESGGNASGRNRGPEATLAHGRVGTRGRGRLRRGADARRRRSGRGRAGHALPALCVEGSVVARGDATTGGHVAGTTRATSA